MALPIFYDVVEFNSFTLENEQDQKKHQIIVYVIQDMAHKPIVSFCYEDVCSVLPDHAMQKSEVYIPDIHVQRNEINIDIFLGYKLNGGCDMRLLLLKIGDKFELTDPLGTARIIRAMFNNYNYIEKTVIDQVGDHDDQIQQLVSQVRKISKYLAQGE